MVHSESVDKLAIALNAAQKVIEGAKKDSENPHFKSKYADLASVWEAARKPLTDHGLSVVQGPSMDEQGRVCVTTMLLHTSGQWIKETAASTTERPGPQAAVSVITYLRRASLAAFAGIAPEDDDGEGAEGRKDGKAQKVVAKAAPKSEVNSTDDAVITEEQQKRLGSIAKKANRPPAEIKLWLKARYGVNSSASIKRSDYTAICAALEARGPLNLPGDGEA